MRSPSLLENGDVHIWQIDVEGGIPYLPQLWDLLSLSERSRACRFAREEDQHQYIVSHGALRCLLACYSNQDPAAISFSTSPEGKPFLPSNRDIEFNLSHAHRLAVLAIARTRVGIDIEHLRSLADAEWIAERFFSHHERIQLQGLRADEKLVAFYRCWTRKEAFLKATGKGLSLPLNSFSVSTGLDEAELIHAELGEYEPALWKIANISTPHNYVGAVAIEGARAHLMHKVWTPICI